MHDPEVKQRTVMQKTYISAQQLLNDSQHLALQILDSGFRPDLIVGIWRGGTPVAIALQEVFDFAGIATDHIAIRTHSYYGIGQQGKVTVDGLEYVEHQLSPDMKMLLVDDIFDTGRSIEAIFEALESIPGKELPEIRIAAPWFKPANNLTSRIPDYYLHETDEWIVFPHELQGLSRQELEQEKPGIASLRERFLALLEKQQAPD